MNRPTTDEPINMFGRTRAEQLAFEDRMRDEGSLWPDFTDMYKYRSYEEWFLINL